MNHLISHKGDSSSQIGSGVTHISAKSCTQPRCTTGQTSRSTHTGRLYISGNQVVSKCSVPYSQITCNSILYYTTLLFSNCTFYQQHYHCGHCHTTRLLSILLTLHAQFVQYQQQGQLQQLATRQRYILQFSEITKRQRYSHCFSQQFHNQPVVVQCMIIPMKFIYNTILLVIKEINNISHLFLVQGDNILLTHLSQDEIISHQFWRLLFYTQSVKAFFLSIHSPTTKHSRESALID